MLIDLLKLGVRYPQHLQLVINANAPTGFSKVVMEQMLSVPGAPVQINLRNIALETAVAITS